jgi:hypothetical protein
MATVNYNQSRVKMFRRCHKQYNFRYDYHEYYGDGAVQEMVPVVHKLPLYRGTWMHALQEALHHQWAEAVPFTQVIGEKPYAIEVEVEKWQDTHQAMTNEFNKLFLEEREELGELPDECERLFRSYLRFWDSDQDTYEVATLPNGKPAVEFLVQAPLTQFGIENGRFKGKIDLLVEDLEYGGLWIWDAKWVKRVPPPDERYMSPQAPLYVWALRKQYGLDVRGFAYNYGRTKPPTVPRVLKRPAGMLSVAHKMDTDLHTYFTEIKRVHGENWKKYIEYYKPKLKELKGREALWFDRQRVPVEDDRILRAVREYLTSVRGIQERETRRDYVDRSYFYNCKFGCEYHDLCVAEFQGLEIEPLVRDGFRFVGERYVREVDLLDG